MELDMRIQNSRRAKAAKRAIENDCDIITLKDIESVPVPNTFIDYEVNLMIQEEARNVLRMSMYNKNDKEYGECAILFSTSDDSNRDGEERVRKEYYGDYERVRIRDDYFRSIMIKRKIQDLILMHNHPNNSLFSGADIAMLCSNYPISAIVAVGNKRNMFILMKCWNSKNNAADYIEQKALKLLIKANEEYNEKNMKKYRDIVAHDVLRNPEQFGLTFEKYKRRHVI